MFNEKHEKFYSLVIKYFDNKSTYNSHCSHHSTFSVAFSLTDVWYFSFPIPIVTNASLVPAKNIKSVVLKYYLYLKVHFFNFLKRVMRIFGNEETLFHIDHHLFGIVMEL